MSLFVFKFYFIMVWPIDYASMILGGSMQAWNIRLRLKCSVIKHSSCVNMPRKWNKYKVAKQLSKKARRQCVKRELNIEQNL